ncbi:hypothetical protein K2Z83_01160 [Oscillochloris sp. ZM17-4]|uniref:hypothetical protein n=1 Tax=Oscillochloris sp. ZM17-4 TaxID=2866714 RepID=UPI001C73A975|nr:hypothetical protein [Oscillochloris sp. ZM17-4]MBX0326302.1 hypothetical protein [Oscillochloris sp. ZM17-4]
MNLWIMIGIVVFVMISQAVLWSWVLIERQRKIPDVKIFNWQELVAEAQKIADNYYKAMGQR